MLEAMLLRREADRSAGSVRDVVGTQPKLEIELPEHLSHLRVLFTGGRIEEAIATLATYDDGAAKLVLARCLAFVKRHDEALAAYEQAARLSAALHIEADLGRADALLGLGRADDALAIFDAMPDHIAAIEGRVLALQQLGREAEADAALAKALAVRGDRAALRVRNLPG